MRDDDFRGQPYHREVIFRAIRDVDKFNAGRSDDDAAGNTGCSVFYGGWDRSTNFGNGRINNVRNIRLKAATNFDNVARTWGVEQRRSVTTSSVVITIRVGFLSSGVRVRVSERKICFTGS